MKKVLFGAFALCFSVASAEDNDSESAREAYEGWNIAAGVSYQYIMNDVLLSDNLALIPPAGAASLKVDNDVMLKSSGGKLGGSLSAGYGLFPTGNFYAGVDLSLDIAGGKRISGDFTKEARGGRVPYGDSSLKKGWLVPTVALKFGGLASWLDCSLAYVRVGAALLHNKFESQWVNQSFSINKVSPVVGFGVEKNFGQFGVRAECDYRFFCNKKRTGLNSDKVEDSLRRVGLGGYSASIENRMRGYVVRVLGVYYF